MCKAQYRSRRRLSKSQLERNSARHRRHERNDQRGLYRRRNDHLGYGPDRAELIAVRPGDYIYPSDVRVDSASGLLYVKARGIAGGLWKETWLYEYDLVRRQQVSKLLVDPNVLPPERLVLPRTK
jgi:hypothetical protein